MVEKGSNREGGREGGRVEGGRERKSEGGREKKGVNSFILSQKSHTS